MNVRFAYSPALAACLLAGLTAATAPGVRAQNLNDGSIYSQYGIGELRSFASSQIQAMGGGGTALSTFNYLNFSNPGTWSDQVLTRFSAGFLYQGLRATEAPDTVSTLSEGTLNAFQFSFPILRQKLGFAVAYEPYSRVSYRVQERDTLEIDPVLSDTAQYAFSYEGGGGLQRIAAGAGYRFNRYLSAGASLDFLFGILEDARRTTFLDASFGERYLASATRLNGFTATLGVHGTIPELTTPNDALQLGASITLPAALNATRVRTISRDEQSTRDTLGSRLDGDVTLPLTARFGAAYVAGDRWTVVADALFQPWSQFESSFPFAGYEPNGYSMFRNRLRASAGVEHLPAGRDLQRPYLARVAYRLGLYYDQSYVSPFVQASGGPRILDDVSTIALTGGLSLPTFFVGTRFDLGFELGTRGSTDGPLVQDEFLRLSASLNFGERWFEQRRLR